MRRSRLRVSVWSMQVAVLFVGVVIGIRLLIDPAFYWRDLWALLLLGLVSALTWVTIFGPWPARFLVLGLILGALLENAAMDYSLRHDLIRCGRAPRHPWDGILLRCPRSGSSSVEAGKALPPGPGSRTLWAWRCPASSAVAWRPSRARGGGWLSMQSKARPVPPLRLEPREWKRPCRSTSSTSRPGPSLASVAVAIVVAASGWAVRWSMSREWRRAQLRRGAVVLAGIEVGLLLILLIRAGRSHIPSDLRDGGRDRDQPEAPAREVARPREPCRAGTWAERGSFVVGPPLAGASGSCFARRRGGVPGALKDREINRPESGRAPASPTSSPASQLSQCPHGSNASSSRPK